MMFLYLLATLHSPELDSGYVEKKPAYAQEEMVISANRHASAAGLEILEKGGNALDAAVAMQMVLNVVEPQSSGIGGGAVLVFYRSSDGAVMCYDGRETAPQKAFETLFLDENKNPLEHARALIGGQSVGVPGVLRMLERAHQEEGCLPWNALFEKAITLAEEGFYISHRLHSLINKVPHLASFPETKHFLFDGGEAKPLGGLLQNPELADTLRHIASCGASAFYEGEIAQQIVRAVQEKGGFLSEEDLQNYTPLKRPALYFSYRGYDLYTAPPPFGGCSLAQILGMLETKDLKGYSLGDPSFINLFSQVSRLAFADRLYYVADPAFFPVPLERLMDRGYLKKRADLVMPQKALQEAPKGTWPGKGVRCCPSLVSCQGKDLPSTSQICVIDKAGNAVSMTSSIENAFGSTIFVRGFFLNNQMTDFSFLPREKGRIAANRIEPYKRPLSAMTPTLVFDRKTHALVLALGAAGGGCIIDYVAQTLVGVLDFKLDIQEAISFPHYCAQRKEIYLEKGSFLEKEIPSLEDMGNVLLVTPLTSGLQGIERHCFQLIGGSDPRREGVALGR